MIDVGTGQVVAALSTERRTLGSAVSVAAQNLVEVSHRWIANGR